MKLKNWLLTIICCLLTFSAFCQHRSDSIHVAHYELNLFIDPFSHDLSGNAVLRIVPKISNLETFNLDLEALTVDSIRCGNTNLTHTHQGTTLRIDAPQYNLGDTFNICIAYHGIPAGNSWGGFTFNNGFYFNLGVNMYNTPHSYGRCWYPCIDEFTDKSTYNFNIETYPYHTAVCGGNLLGCSDKENGNKIWHWQLDQPISSYLTSVATAPYQLYADTFHGMEADIPITIYATSSYINNVAGSFAHLKDITHNYESKFGPLRFNRIGYVLVNFNQGAMEHATNITYPQASVDGTSANESLYAHELSHSWFGNLVTCETAEEMWINEGFASYCEALTDEYLYSEGQYTTKINSLHADVLQNLQNRDGGFFALNNVPQNKTYGMHSYDKGSIVIHTLRNYLGDSLFFDGIRAYLNQYAFSNINSEELFTFLSNHTHTDLSGFYEGWINQPGFPHFSIDSIVPESDGQYAVYVRQRLYHANNFVNDNKVCLTFFSDGGERYDHNGFIFSGEHGIAHVNIPFMPKFGVVDYNNDICDAIIDYNKIVKWSGSNNFANANVNFIVSDIQDSSHLRIEYNFVNPDPIKNTSAQAYRLNKRYWRIEYTNSEHLNGRLRFNYNASNSNQSEYELLQGHAVDELTLLYRRGCDDDWHTIPFTRTGQLNGTVTTDSLRAGEYVLAVPGQDVGINEQENVGNDAKIFLRPNPARDYVSIVGNDFIQKLEIYDVNGKKIKEFNNINPEGMINVRQFNSGTYIFKVYGKDSIIKDLIFIKND